MKNNTRHLCNCILQNNIEYDLFIKTPGSYSSRDQHKYIPESHVSHRDFYG